MRKIFFLALAAFILTSCDNLKKKDVKSDDEEETTTKKKKPLNDESTDDEDVPKKKKTTTEDDEEDKPVVKKDDPAKDDVDYTAGWSKTDKAQFLNECVPEAAKKIGNPQANTYCSCYLEKLEKKYTSYSDANGKLKEPEITNIANECNGQQLEGRQY